MSPSCPSLRILWLKAFPKSPSRMTHLQAFPHPSWEAAIPKQAGMKGVKMNDCRLMQFILQPGLQIQIQVPSCNLDRGLSELMKLIPTPTHVVSETTSQSLSTPPGMSISVPVMSPSSLFQTHQLCQAPLPGMNQSRARPTIWS